MFFFNTKIGKRLGGEGVFIFPKHALTLQVYPVPK